MNGPSAGCYHEHNKGALGPDLSKYKLIEPTRHQRKGHGCQYHQTVISKSLLHVMQVFLCQNTAVKTLLFIHLSFLLRLSCLTFKKTSKCSFMCFFCHNLYINLRMFAQNWVLLPWLSHKSPFSSTSSQIYTLKVCIEGPVHT